jgi:hypothetical protein
MPKAQSNEIDPAIKKFHYSTNDLDRRELAKKYYLISNLPQHAA